MMMECYASGSGVPNHIDWPTLKANLPRLKAKRIMMTHLGEATLRFIPDMEQAGVAIASDGAVIEI
jgi:hypothetical protein